MERTTVYQPQLESAGPRWAETVSGFGSASLPKRGQAQFVRPGVRVREGRIGQEVYTSRPLGKGQILLRGWGERVPRRMQHSMQIDWDTHILPDAPLHLLNHSCEPNCGPLVRPGVAELQIHALRPIRAGEALTLDYETFECEILFMPGLCLCGAPTCRGRISGHKNLSHRLRQEYGVYVAPYLRG